MPPHPLQPDLAEALAFLQQACESSNEDERAAARLIYGYFEREVFLLTGSKESFISRPNKAEPPNRDRRYFNG